MSIDHHWQCEAMRSPKCNWQETTSHLISTCDDDSLAWVPVYTRSKHPDFGLLCKHIEPNLGWWYEKSFQIEMCAEVNSGWTACWRKNCSKGGGAHCHLILKKIVTFQVMKTSCVFYAMERRTFSCTATSFWYLTLSKLNISTWNCKFVVMSISLLQET